MQRTLRKNSLKNVHSTSTLSQLRVLLPQVHSFVQPQLHTQEQPGRHRRKHQHTLSQNEQCKGRVSRLNFFNKKRDLPAQVRQPDSIASISSTSKSAMDSEPASKRAKTKATDLINKEHLIIRFYDQDVQAKDSHDRTLEELLSWNDTQLERSHNYIQMLFPLPEGSPYNWSAPVVTREVFDAFRSRSELRDRMRVSFERMLDFYGFTVSRESAAVLDSQQGDSEKGAGAKDVATQSMSVASADSTSTSPEDDDTSGPSAANYTIVRGPKWRNHSTNWCVRFDHNHLRITRMLRCLRVMGLQTECDAFFKALQQVVTDPAIPISDRSMMYWTHAVQRPLYQAPDDDTCDWLKEWEAEQRKGSQY
ncbi:hypothetical protein NX059_010114 [Plenodomus lindquistii]|nr:hypothetical protein NX059_010114 [Plenodomus lindquistii]